MVSFTTELLQVADAVSREKNIARASIVEAMEQAIEIAARKKYGYENKIRAKIGTDGIKLFREREVVLNEESVEKTIDEETGEETGGFDSFTQITLEHAQQKNPDTKVGDIISEELPPIDLGRVAAQTAKQVIIQKVREAEKEKQYEEYKNRAGEIVNGLVKRIDYGNIVVGLDQATEAVIQRDQQIRSEAFKINDRVRAYICDVKEDSKGHQIFLSRTAPEFMAKLFAQEVPEIYDNIIEIMAVAREPGARAKIAVTAHDAGIDPVGSCVGVRGARVQAVINELQGEKIDIIQYSPDPATFIVNALAPAEVIKVVIDEENNRIEVVVPEDQLSLAIGRRGQNVRLAAELTGWNIDVLSDEQESKRRIEEFNNLSALFVEALNVEEVIAQLLATEGFTSVEDVAYVALSDLVEIEGFDEEIAAELQQRAEGYLAQKAESDEKSWRELGVSEEIAAMPHITAEIMISLGKAKVKSLDDFADLARDEFKEMVPESGLKDNQIDESIMKAREHWFAEEEGKKEEKEA